MSSLGCNFYSEKWVDEGNMSKLLGTPFGFNLDINDVNEFLVGRFKEKLKYWSMIHLSLTSRVVVINSILTSSLCFFANVWVESKNFIKKCM
jgi:hypothetical protein